MITLILNRFEVKQESISNLIKYDRDSWVQRKWTEKYTVFYKPKDYLTCQKITWSPKNLNTNDLNSVLVCSYLRVESFSCRISPYLCLRTWRLCPIPFITCHFLVVYTLPIVSLLTKLGKFSQLLWGNNYLSNSRLLSTCFCVWLPNNSK